MKNITAKVRHILPIDDEVMERFLASFSVKVIQKNQHVLKVGAVAKHIYFIENGLLYGSSYKNDKEIVHWIAAETEFITSLYSFVSQKPSFENIIALEDTTLYCLHARDLQALYTDFPVLERLGRLLTEHYYIQLEERTLSLQYQSAAKRYADFVANHPALLQRISLGFLASYLGVSQETLSRVRAHK